MLASNTAFSVPGYLLYLVDLTHCCFLRNRFCYNKIDNTNTILKLNLIRQPLYKLISLWCLLRYTRRIMGSLLILLAGGELV